jgi:hypothetical protein
MLAGATSAVLTLLTDILGQEASATHSFSRDSRFPTLMEWLDRIWNGGCLVVVLCSSLGTVLMPVVESTDESGRVGAAAATSGHGSQFHRPSLQFSGCHRPNQ